MVYLLFPQLIKSERTMINELSPVKIPMLSVTPSGVCMYHEWHGPRRSRMQFDECGEFLPASQQAGRIRPASNHNNGIMSEKAKKRIENALKWMLYLSPSKKIYHRDEKRWVKFRLCFVTLTLSASQQHTDKEIKSKLLYQFLDEMRAAYNVTHYVWRAEKQSNGNIHFHLVVNRFIPHMDLRKRWNRIIEKLGYVSRYQQKMTESIHDFADYYNMFIGQGSYQQLMRRYNYGRATRWTNPNTVDIHSIVKVHNLAAYLCKYMAKSVKDDYERIEDIPESLKVAGKLWGLSQSLSQLKTVSTPITTAISEEIETIYQWAKDKVFSKDYFTWIRISFRQLIKLKCDNIMRHVFDEMAKYNEKSLTFT